VADGIVFERLGVQAASIVTDAFTQSGNAMAGIMGAHGYRYAMVPHPLSNLTVEECHARAREVLPEVLEILGLESGSATTRVLEGPEAAGANGHAAVAIDDLNADRVADLRRLIEHCFQRGWTDGLPVVPITEATVREFVSYVGRDPGQEIATLSHLGRSCTVEMAAAAAAMAGCTKELFPVLLSVMDSIQPSLNTGLLQSTTGQCQLIIVNGPARRRLGFNGAGNVFGPGYRANATVGRALRLVVMNAFGLRPGELDQATQGTPAKYSFCIAENEEESPWEPLHVERGFAAGASVTTVHFARSNLHVENRISNQPEQVLLTIADSMSYAGSWQAGRGYTVVMGPEHAQLLARHGWSKQDAKQFLWEHWGRRKGDLRRLGLLHDGADTDPLAGPVATGADDEFLRFGESPDSILLVVAGANNAGMSTVVPMVRPLFHSREFTLPG
jgi:hypothetical protein